MKQKDISKITEIRLDEAFDLLCNAEKNMVKACSLLKAFDLDACINFCHKVEQGEDPTYEVWLHHAFERDITRCDDILRLIDAIFAVSEVFNNTDDEGDDE